ncbi:uncharacterized protein BYT42DRAFT_23513 [Radiomyces spectabilis]|uniref:uncharacterized protein n=1 Tax=Radiomyces spectabilis TaxID=64574 RepID=UPI00221EAAD8|nr:uncharacterized protein BYT42DRAFT_23513 [Radiomyces spectabilis]KAI8393914.1 hypothetical protein BYT42DRAFT_23513 [Radiomyces spectabilis]
MQQSVNWLAYSCGFSCVSHNTSFNFRQEHACATLSVLVIPNPSPRHGSPKTHNGGQIAFEPGMASAVCQPPSNIKSLQTPPIRLADSHGEHHLARPSFTNRQQHINWKELTIVFTRVLVSKCLMYHRVNPADDPLRQMMQQPKWTISHSGLE